MKKHVNKSIMALVNGCAALMSAGHVFAATLHLENTTIVLRAGQTIEIPLQSTKPIAGDLTASGAFEPGDVTFTASPTCHLSAHGCTLLVHAAPTSKTYTAVPVVVSESAASNTPVFALSVIHPGDPAPVNIQLTSEEVLRHQRLHVVSPTPTHTSSPSLMKDDTPAPIQHSGSALFYGIAEPHPALGATNAAREEKNNDFTPATNGAAYQIVKLTNHDVTQPLSITITGSGAHRFTLDKRASDYGINQNCATINQIASQESCLVIIKGKVGDPNQAPETATLTLQGAHDNVASFTLTNTTYVYAAGGFNTLGNASVSGGNLLAQCTAGTCSNALQGSSGNNYASKEFGVGNWINALAITPAGNLIVGGVFGAIGGATSGASGSPEAALLAQCTPGSRLGNACINQLNTGSTASPYAFSNAYIDGIAPPTATPGVIYLGGDFSNIRGVSVTTGQKMLAKCTYSGTSENQTCSNYLGNSSKYANAAISAVNFLNSQVNVGGLFTQIAGSPSSPPTSGTTFASCSSSGCGQGLGSSNPNGSILGMTNDGSSLYMGGSFKTIGGYEDTSGGYPLVSCTLGAPTPCENALSGSNDANGYIEGLAYSEGNLYVGGNFTTIGGATLSGGNMLAVCTPGGGCSNFVTDTNPYATGSDWGGGIFAIAIGNQTSITAN